MNEESLLEELLDRYEDAIENGEPADPVVLCREMPHLVDKLRGRINALQKMDGYLVGQNEPRRQSDENTLRISCELTRLQFHAKGGLGAVYRANESSVNRDVAVKFIHRNLVDDTGSRERFSLEAEVTGRLEHPGVVPLYGIGETSQGRMFYYMRFIDGETLDESIHRFHHNHTSRNRFSDHSVEFRRLLASFISACRTIAYAHNRGIVHRDIKPSNIMLGKFGETMVVDWGLAVPVKRDQRFALSGEMSLRPQSARSSGTSTASGVGTVAYMSPEQASELAPSPASDIYSLGATLYKIITGEPSLSGNQTTELRQRIVTGDIPRPTERLPSVPPVLESICRRAMALHPKDRYATALDLADDIESYLADSPVSAYNEPLSRRIARFARKHRSATQTAVVALICLFIVTTTAAFWLGALARSEAQARKEADDSQLHAERERVVAQKYRRENLKTSAEFLAQSIAAEIDNRWRVLENARSSPKLIELMKTMNSSPENTETREQLQSWLDRCKQLRNVFRSPDDIWVLFSMDSTRVARNPPKQVDDELFMYRDYFHGFGKDFKEGDSELQGQSLKPHQFVLEKLQQHETMHSAHLSDVYLGNVTKHLQVTFSVPIWDRPAEEAEKRAIGVFSISLEIQNLNLLENAMLVQTRPSQVSGKSGMVISHFDLKPHTDTNPPPHFNEIIPLAEELKRLRMRNVSLQRSPGVDSILDNFIDPVVAENTGVSTPCFAAFEPVIIKTRPKAIQDIHWLVIVKEPSRRDSASAGSESAAE